MYAEEAIALREASIFNTVKIDTQNGFHLKPILNEFSHFDFLSTKFRGLSEKYPTCDYVSVLRLEPSVRHLCKYIFGRNTAAYC